MIKKTVLTFLLIITGLSLSLGANTYTLVIDAGHGGHDAGAKGAYSQEKDINLKVALAFGQLVEQNCKDVKVIYTRKTDTFIPLKERANIANRNNADLFVSVHTNALPNGRIARGFEVYTLGMHRAKDNLDVAMRENSVIEEEDNYKKTYQGFDPKSSESYIMFEFMQSANMLRSVELAKLIQKSVCSTADRNNMGVHQAGFLVLRETSMPSCLIELGFITTPDEEDYLNTDDGVDKLANGIYKAFLEYKNKYPGKSATKSTTTVPPVTDSPKKEDSTSLSPARKAPTVDSDNPPTKAPAAKVSGTVNKPETPSNVSPAKKGQTVTNKPAKPKATPETKKQPADKSKQKIEAKQPTQEQKNPAQEQKKSLAKPSDISKDEPIFKVQVFAVSRKLTAKDPLFKGHSNVDSYTEKGSNLIKYTIGSDNDYDAIVQLKNSLRSDFPQAYIVAIKNGEPMELSKAINEFKKNKRKQNHNKK